jgi:hypothetical protein
MLGTANIKVRPLKLALLVDPNSASQVRQAIRLACSLWGGMFFPIIPTYRRMPISWREGPLRVPSARTVVLGQIDAFDPDVLVQFATSVPKYIADTRLRVVKPDDVLDQSSSETGHEPSFGIGVLELLRDIYAECFKYTSKYPVKVAMPAAPRELGLFWASVFGEYSNQIASVITDNFSEALEIERPLATPEAFLSLTGPKVLFPRRITSWGLSQHGGLGFGRQACVYFMDASSTEDIVDYWNLRATGRSVVPLPKQFAQVDSFKRSVEQFLIEERRAWGNDSKHFDVASIIRSRHSTMEEMTAFAKTLDLAAGGQSDPANRFYGLQHWYPRIWDEWARGKDGGAADIYGQDETTIDISGAADLNMRLKPVLPKFASRPLFHTEGICVNEFDLRLYGADEHLAEVYPKAKGDHLIRAISGMTGLGGEWRIGRHGLVHLVRRDTSESRVVPASETVLFAWLADQGWKAELSPPGILAKQIFKRLNGFPRLIGDKAVLGLIEYMNGGAVGKNGEPLGDGRLTQEREVSVGEMKNRLRGRWGKGSLYDEFLSKGIFKIGLRTKCQNCQRNTWFPLPTLRESLECPKCLSAFAAAGNIETSSGWYYRTAGPFSVPNYADGAFAVLLTLDALDGRMLSSLRTTSVPSFTATSAGKGVLEADFAMFWRETSRGDETEGLMFGECKTYGAFETKDVDRMRHLGAMFPGAVLVFSTLRETLSKKEIVALKRLAKSGRKYWKAKRPINPVLILTSTELLKWERPPYCWTEAQQKQFHRVHGLLSLCNATQQLYLGLPSWHEEWHNRWEKKSARRQLRDVVNPQSVSPTSIPSRPD